MKLTADNAILNVQGNIKSVEHFQQLKTELDKMKAKHTSITIKLQDSLSITSSVIGYLMKLIHKENIRISLIVSDDRLINLLNDLGLSNEFNVKKA